MAGAGSYSGFKKETAGDVSTLQATAEPPRQQLASDRYVIAKPARPVRRQPVRARRAGAALSLEPLPPKGARARRLAWRLAVAVCNVPDATTPARSLSGATRCGRVGCGAGRRRTGSKRSPPLADRIVGRAHATTPARDFCAARRVLRRQAMQAQPAAEAEQSRGALLGHGAGSDPARWRA